MQLLNMQNRLEVLTKHRPNIDVHTLRALTGLSDVNLHGKGPNLVATFMLVFVSF